MKLRKAQLFCLFSLLTTAGQFTAADTFCAVEDVADTAVAGRAKQIRFPDGRLLTVVGHHTGDRQALLLNKTPKEVQAMSSAQFLNYFRSALKDNKAPTKSKLPVDPKKLASVFEGAFGLPSGTIGALTVPAENADSVLTHALADQKFLLARLKDTADRPEFVAIESVGHESLDQARSNYMFVKSQVEARKAKLKMTDQQAQEFMTSGATGPLEAYIANPELAKATPLIAPTGAAADDGKTQGLDMKSGLKLVSASQAYLASADSEQRKQAILQLTKLAPTLVKLFIANESRFAAFESADDLVDEMQKSLPPWLEDSAKGLMENAHSYIQSLMEQDRQLAQTMVDQKKSGIQFVGLEHLDSVMKRVARQCHAENLAQQVVDHPQGGPLTYQ